MTIHKNRLVLLKCAVLSAVTFVSDSTVIASHSSDLVDQRRTFETEIDDADVSRLVDQRLEFAGRYFLDPAREAKCNRTKYNAWVNAVGSALRSESSPPGEGSIVLADAESEIEPFRRPYPPMGHDLATAVAIRESSQLNNIGRYLSYVFRGQPSNIRDAAAKYFEDTYSIHPNATKCSPFEQLINQ